MCGMRLPPKTNFSVINPLQARSHLVTYRIFPVSSQSRCTRLTGIAFRQPINTMIVSAPEDNAIYSKAILFGDPPRRQVFRADHRDNRFGCERRESILAHRAGRLCRQAAILPPGMDVVANLQFRTSVHVLPCRTAIAHQCAGLFQNHSQQPGSAAVALPLSLDSAGNLLRRERPRIPAHVLGIAKDRQQSRSVRRRQFPKNEARRLDWDHNLHFRPDCLPWILGIELRQLTQDLPRTLVPYLRNRNFYRYNFVAPRSFVRC